MAAVVAQARPVAATRAALAESALRKLSWCGEGEIAARARAAIRVLHGVPCWAVEEALVVDLHAVTGRIPEEYKQRRPA